MKEHCNEAAPCGAALCAVYLHQFLKLIVFIFRNWIDSLSAGATENFLRGAELGVLLNEAIIVCNAAIYIWNYNHHLLVSGRYAELVKPFQALLAALKITGHSG